jgi:hypothetical protein
VAADARTASESDFPAGAGDQLAPAVSLRGRDT